MIRTLCTFLAAAVFAACSADHDHDHGTTGGAGAHGNEAHEHGPHGGHLLDLGTAHAAHLEVVHDEAAGTMTLYVLGGDGKTALAADSPPELKLTTSAGPKLLATKATDGANTTFAVTDDALKTDPEGRITVVVGGKTYNPALAHDHDH